MDSNQQPDRLNPWSATFQERRTALFIAVVCIVVIGAAMLAPQWFKSKGNTDTARTGDMPEQQETASADRQAYRIKAAPPVAPVTANTPVDRATASPAEKPASKPVVSEPVVSKPVLVIPPAPVSKPKPAAKPATPRTTRVAQPPAGFFVQVGAFKDRTHADQLRKKLIANGFNSRLVDRGNGLVGVWIGPEDSRPAVDKLQQELEKRLHMQGFVTHSG